MKRISFVCDDDKAQFFVDDAKVTNGLIAVTDADGNEVEIQTQDMTIEDVAPDPKVDYTAKLPNMRDKDPNLFQENS